MTMRDDTTIVVKTIKYLCWISPQGTSTTNRFWVFIKQFNGEDLTMGTGIVTAS